MTIAKIVERPPVLESKKPKNIPSIVFIVPYRARENQKQLFQTYMKYLMEDYDSERYEIYFAHQCDKRPFNRGAVKNIGFLAIKNLYPEHYRDITLVFNDVDTMPFNKNLLNYEIETAGSVKHFYGFTFALGGIFSIKGSDFEKVNGFPNYWGWGLEDNVIQKRLTDNNIVIDRNQFYPIHSREILQIHDDVKRLVSNRQPGQAELTRDKASLNSNVKPDGILGISNLKYTINNNNSSSSSSNLCVEHFMIDITGFDTPNKPENDKYFYQDLSMKSKIVDNRLGKVEQRQRFGMKYY